MESSDVVKASIWEDGGVTNLARVKGQTGANITQASISSIRREIFDRTVPATVGTTTLTIATAVFDTLQTGGPWSKDTTGYNFKDAIGSTNFANGDRRYRVQYKFTPASGAAFWVVYELYAKALVTT